MKKTSLMFGALLIVLAGCGQKGPLYLPQPATPSSPDAPKTAPAKPAQEPKQSSGSSSSTGSY